VSSTAEQLDEVWDEVGYTPEERTSQLSDLLVQFRNLCEAKLAEEHGVAETFHQTISETKAEIIATSKALRSTVDDNLLDETKNRGNGSQNQASATLTDQLAILEATLEGLREAAMIARNCLIESKEFLAKAHEMLGLTLDDQWDDVDNDLTIERRHQFHRKVEEMKEEISTRSSAVIQLIRDCQHLMNDLRIDVASDGSPLDQQIAGSLVRGENGNYMMASNFRTEACTGISASALEDLTSRVTALNAEKRRRTSKLEEMGAKIMTLWEKLRISEEEQRAFSETIQGLGLDTIEKGETELRRLCALKSEMLGKLILEARDTIVALWDEMNATDDYRSTFEAFHVVDESHFTEELLETHEEYIESLREQLEEMKPILRIIERREVILRERMEYQELQKDSDRLKQRGAALTRQLMEEEKMARRIKRDLPKLNSLMREKLEEWKENHNKEFQLHGEDYFEIMKRQEAEWVEYKSKHTFQKKKHDERLHSDTRSKAPLLKKSSARPLRDGANRENTRSTSRVRTREVEAATKPASSSSRSRAPAF